MAIIKCPSCGTLVSDHAKKCPKCGRNILVTSTASAQDKAAIANLVCSISRYKEQIFEMEYARVRNSKLYFKEEYYKG